MNHNLYNSKQQLGFSLIEILVVVVIISLFTAAVAFSFKPKDTASELRQQSLRLQSVLSIALDEAQIQGVEMGLVVTDEGYQFLFLNENIWQPVVDDKALDTHYWPKQTEIFLTLEGLQSSEQEGIKQFSLSDNFSGKLSRDRERDASQQNDFNLDFSLEEQNQQDESLKTQPQIYILSSGETTPFELLIMQLDGDDEVYFQISADYLGSVNIDGPFQEKPNAGFENE
jgi:general secretion pathway protein H